MPGCRSAEMRAGPTRDSHANAGPPNLHNTSKSNLGTGFLHVLLTDMRDAAGVRKELQLGPVAAGREDSTRAAINAVMTALSGNLRTLRKTSRATSVAPSQRTFQGCTS
jgi:hypothetical protein